MEDRLKTIIEQAKDNGTHKKLMAAVREYEQTTTADIPNSCILSKDKERILKYQLKGKKYK